MLQLLQIIFQRCHARLRLCQRRLPRRDTICRFLCCPRCVFLCGFQIRFDAPRARLCTLGAALQVFCGFGKLGDARLCSGGSICRRRRRGLSLLARHSQPRLGGLSGGSALRAHSLQLGAQRVARSGQCGALLPHNLELSAQRVNFDLLGFDTCGGLTRRLRSAPQRRLQLGDAA
ncbi:MAG: hypothetical protein AAGE13_09495, partial [Pseudomonadota bacterium]